MEPTEALEAIRTLARVALSMADGGLSLETLAEQYQRSLSGILVVTEGTPGRQAAHLACTTRALNV